MSHISYGLAVMVGRVRTLAPKVLAELVGTGGHAVVLAVESLCTSSGHEGDEDGESREVHVDIERVPSLKEPGFNTHVYIPLATAQLRKRETDDLGSHRLLEHGRAHVGKSRARSRCTILLHDQRRGRTRPSTASQKPHLLMEASM